MIVAFHFLAALNFIDAILSFLGIKLNIIREVNPLMAYVYAQHPFLFLIVKMSFSILLYCFLFTHKVPETNKVKYPTYTAVMIYSFVFSLHVYWLVKI